jgi:hypothetical protein
MLESFVHPQMEEEEVELFQQNRAPPRFANFVPAA